MIGYSDEDLDYEVDDALASLSTPPPSSPIDILNRANEASVFNAFSERKEREEKSPTGSRRNSPLRSRKGSQPILPTDPPGSERVVHIDPPNSNNPLDETIPSLCNRVDQMKSEYAAALYAINEPTKALQNAISLPDGNPDKAATVATAQSRLDQATQLHNALKNLYETHCTMLSIRLQAEPVATTAPSGSRDATKAEQRLDLQVQHARSELAKKAPAMYKGHKLSTNDSIPIWKQRLYDFSYREYMNQSMAIAATMAQLSPEVRAECEHVPEAALQHIDQFLDFIFKSQTQWWRYSNATALETLFNNCYQLVGPKHSSGGYEYAETFPAFITRVHRFARILYPRMDREQIGSIVARQVQLGLNPRWREHMFATASNSGKYNFPSCPLTLTTLEDIAMRICNKPDFLGKQPVTLELFPTVCYRAQVSDGDLWFVPKCPCSPPDASMGRTGPVAPKTSQSSSSSSASSSRNSRSSHEPRSTVPKPSVQKPVAQKPVVSWEEKKKQRCTYHEARGVNHLLENCPDRDQATGKILFQDNNSKQTGRFAKKLKPNGSE